MHALKIIEETEEHAIIGGYGVVFGGDDLDEEGFEPDTDFMLDLVPVKPVFIDHSEDTFIAADGKTYKLAGIDDPVGKVIEVTPDDEGLYMRLQFDKAGRYWSLVERMVNSGKAGLSSGTIGHLARRKGSRIVRWPIVEESITLTPAEPRTVGVVRLKHVAEMNPGLKAIIPEAESATAVDDATEGEQTAAEVGAGQPAIEIIETEMESEDMSGENTTQPAAENEQIKALSARVDQVLQLIENSPALKSAGYATDDGGDADPSHKSFGDFLLAVKRGDTKRLNTVYKARRDDSDGDTKDMYEAAGPAGGYLVPEAYSSQLIELAAKRSPIYDRVTKIPVTTAAGRFPTLNQFAAPTAGSGATAYAAGVTVGSVAELETLPEVQPSFEALNWRVHKVGGIVEVSNELNSDSPTSIEALLRRLFAIAIASKNERNILRGSGAGEPLGILNSNTAIGITTATNDVFAYADVLAMMAQFEPIGGGDPVWIMHRSLMPDLGVLAVASGSPVVWAGNLAERQPGSLMGYPIIFSEHMPRANGDDAILADLSAYVMFERAGLSIAYSEHAAFEKDAVVWRFTARNDGQPWHKGPITLADPGGSYTASPFVYHND